MKRFALLAAAAAAVGVSACTGSTAPRAAPETHTTKKPIVPVSCSQQYRNWTQGEGSGLMAALDDVSAAAAARDGKVLTAALKQAKPAVARAATHPIPACADPRGYWTALLMHVNAAGAGTAPASSVRAAMRDVPKIHRQLVAEVRQTAE